MNRTLLASAALAAAVLTTAHAGAAVIATYDFNTYTVSSDSGAAVGATSPNLTATNFVPNSGTATPPTGPTGFKGFAGNTATAGNYMFTTNSGTAFGVQSTNLPATEALAVSNATYYSFTLTPTAGGNLSFAAGDNLTFQQSTRVLSGGTTPYTTNFFIRTSADGFATTLGTPTQTQTGVGSNALGTPTNSISLASLGTLAANAALTVRFYAYDNANTTTNDIKIDNVLVNGTATAAVPEPATLGAIGAAAVALLARRRRA